MLQRISALAVALVVLAGCSASASGSPAGSAVPTATASPANLEATPSPAATATPAPAPTVEPSVVPSPVVYYEVQKNAEGGHGGPPLIALPASIAIDYSVRGTCTFSIDLDTTAITTGPQLRLAVTGPEMSGTWRLSIPAGSYYVLTGEAVGCTFDVTVGPG
jgi:hypothetical protein